MRRAPEARFGVSLLVVVVLIGALWVASRAVQAEEAPTVSMVQLLANPEKWQGRVVRVVGYCHFEFEGNALYLHAEDLEQRIRKNARWLAVGWPVPEKYRSVNDSYVMVEGVFDAQREGHMSAFSGLVQKIRLLERWPSRAEVGTIVPPPTPRE